MSKTGGLVCSPIFTNLPVGHVKGLIVKSEKITPKIVTMEPGLEGDNTTRLSEISVVLRTSDQPILHVSSG